MGRPCKLTPEVTQKICDAVRVGLPYADCAKLAGVSYEVIKVWRRRGEQGDEPYATFLAALQAADAECIHAALKIVGGAKEWQSKAWLLERRRPQDFGRRVVHEGRDGGPIEVAVIKRVIVDKDGDKSA